MSSGPEEGPISMQIRGNGALRRGIAGAKSLVLGVSSKRVYLFGHEASAIDVNIN
ncbi:hypothetical protein PROFUN_10342 [Planoprotostelium fungivorum]|uniref:Uncharacterized protein n=1 Tax=Planoprotostelium fungivorum TaxID=1890364 RepID=A0A2P6NDU5_9EUKA|nr:hypothetical protein PROFUN_10342 [Planoprotostelium fungivorum]